MHVIRRLVSFVLLVAAHPAPAQWMMQDSHTTAGLRGIHSLAGVIAWASGTEGTILRTTNAGKDWLKCAIPPNAEKLDFRGVQAFDQNTAIVMSTGPGDQSRIYKTSDGCLTWKLVFTNPDAPNGFFDAIQFVDGIGDLIGDPIADHFAVFRSNDFGDTWTRREAGRLTVAGDKEALFAASNSSLLELSGQTLFVTGGPVSRSLVIHSVSNAAGDIPLSHGISAGAFSVAYADNVLVAVGGDYQHPEVSAGTCATSSDRGLHWSVSQTSPRGYRSSVAYDTASKTWVAVGPNGTDVSTDNGRNWHMLGPSSAEPADSDKNWNGLSLPFVVGPKGRIGRLREDAIKH